MAVAWVGAAGAWSRVESYGVCECVCWCVCAEKLLRLVEECALFLLPCLGLYGECSDVLSRAISLFRLKTCWPSDGWALLSLCALLLPTSSSPICRSCTHTLSYFGTLIHTTSHAVPLPLHIPLWTFACATSSSVWVVLSVVMVKVVGFCDALCVYIPEILDVRWSLWALRWCRNSGTLWILMSDMKWWKMVVLCGNPLWTVWNVCRCVIMSKNDLMSNVVWLICLLLCMPLRVWLC